MADPTPIPTPPDPLDAKIVCGQCGQPGGTRRSRAIVGLPGLPPRTTMNSPLRGCDACGARAWIDAPKAPPLPKGSAKKQ